MKRKISKCTGGVPYVRRRGRVQQNWMAVKEMISMVGDKTKLENIKR